MIIDFIFDITNMTALNYTFTVYNVVADSINSARCKAYGSNLHNNINDLLYYDRTLTLFANYKDVCESYRNYIKSRGGFKCVFVKNFNFNENTFSIRNYNDVLCSLHLNKARMLDVIDFAERMLNLKHEYEFKYKTMLNEHTKIYEEHITTFVNIIIEIKTDINNTKAFNTSLCNKLYNEYETIHKLCIDFQTKVTKFINEFTSSYNTIIELKKRIDTYVLSNNLDVNDFNRPS